MAVTEFLSTLVGTNKSKGHLKIIRQDFGSSRFLRVSETDEIFKVPIALSVHVLNTLHMPNTDTIQNSYGSLAI